jgi:hypothetical protein
MIYIEEGAKDYEFLYAHGSRAVIENPRTADMGTDPGGRTPIQAFINDRWEIAFCDLNPHACLTPEQQQQRDRAAATQANRSTNWTLPFSGIGSTSGDNRSNEQRLKDKAWWENYTAAEVANAEDGARPDRLRWGRAVEHGVTSPCAG